ncbi:ATP-binding protein [Ideonella sp.]|uniref:hybrid sensor histidine kinase/response regulator n=1 Tax=Ideonella sp. TaxID=1929293 RepID=UPI0035B1918A
MVVVEHPGLRWLLAAAIPLATLWLNMALMPLTGGRGSYLAFFPALVMVGALAGGAPGALALGFSTGLLMWQGPAPSVPAWNLGEPADVAVMVLFLLAGGLVVALASTARHLLRAAQQTRCRLDDALAASRRAHEASHEAHEAGRAVRQRFEVALRASSTIVWEADARGHYTWLHNPDPTVDSARFVGQRVGLLVPEAARATFDAAVAQVLGGGPRARVDVSVPVADDTRHYLTSIEAVTDAAGHVTGLIGASTDVTALRQVQQQLQRELRRKDEFLATLAHELRNPMAPIRYAVALLAPDASDASRQQARQVIERQAAHMARLLDDLLDMSRVTRNAIELRQEGLDLRLLAEQAVEAANGLMAQHGHRLALLLPTEPLPVRGDATRLLQVLGNLLDNAAKYTDSGGEVRLALAREGDQAVVRVTDNGIGLTPEMRTQVFELFTQVHRLRPQRVSGLGIGLAVVRQLVELHGGRVRADSPGLGAGSCFTVTLPLDASAAPLGAAEAPPSNVLPWPRRSGEVLVVDDNRDAADTLATLLRAEGLAVAVAYDAAGALRAVEAGLPPLVLLDIGLPDASGWQLAAALRGQPGGARCRLVAVTGWGQETDRARSAAAGFDAHLVKPVSPQAVRHEVALALPAGDAPAAAAGGLRPAGPP